MKNRILGLCGHICFVIVGLLMLKLMLTGSFEFESFKGSREYGIGIEEAQGSFEESYAFNSMFGSSVSDILNYGALKHSYESTPELQNSVSANVVGAGNISSDLNRYGKYLDKGNTNLDYFIISDFEGKTDIFSNLGLDRASAKSYRSTIQDKCGAYIYYDSVNNEFETNTKITQETLLKLIEKSGYSYSSAICMMVGLSKSLSVTDSFRAAFFDYKAYTSNIYLELGICVIGAFVLLVILVLRTFLEGRVVDKETKKVSFRLALTDTIPCEIRLALIAICISLFTGILSILTESVNVVLKLYRSPGTYLQVVLITGAFLLIVSLVASYFYYGFIRRLKSHVIYKTSLLNMLITKLRDVFERASSNKGAVGNALLKVGAVAIVNFVLTAATVLLYLEQKDLEGTLILMLLVAANFGMGAVAYNNYKERKAVLAALERIAGGDVTTKIDAQAMHFDNVRMANSVNQIGEAVNTAVAKSMKDEKMKADLITNVSHDLKTPLTSIINYVDLLKKEAIDNENALEYIRILDEKSQRLKQLTDDLVEASKLSSGNYILNMEKIELKELLIQATGEFMDRFDEKGLSVNATGPEEAVYINADPARMFRIIENLFNNIYKYAMENTRVYLDIKLQDQKAYIFVKNISRQELNVSAEELMERFVRGDEARSSEGSGLGLSIAKSLTEAMGGSFNIALDGDLFKVIMSFNQIAE